MTEDRKKSGIDDARGLIDVFSLIDVLERHALGEIKMTSTQVSAALALLKKVMPDISSSVTKSKKENDKIKTHEEALKELE